MPPKKKAPYRGHWKPKAVQVRVSRHDHVGNMVFLDEEGEAGCRACGQTWTKGEYAWIPDPYTGRM
jgi:hypothetical protein